MNKELPISQLPQMPKDPFNVLHRFMDDQETQIPTSVSTSLPKIVATSLPSITSKLTASLAAVHIGGSIHDTVVEKPVTTSHQSTSSLKTAPSVESGCPCIHSGGVSRPNSTVNTWTTFTPFQPIMATTTNSTPTVSIASCEQFKYRSHLVEIPASSPFQLTNSPPTTRHVVQPEIQQNQQLAEALAKVTQLHRLPQAKADIYRGDEEDKTRYFLWESAFDALVDSAPVTDRQKLHLLYQHLEGRAKKVVEQLQYMIEDPSTAYKEARRMLKDRFGHSAILESDFENKLTNWPKIGNSDAQGIQEFGDFLQQVKIASQYIPNLKIFEFPSKIQSLFEKLPLWFRKKWSGKVQKLQQEKGHNAFPSFSDLLKEVTFHAEHTNIPQIKSFHNNL